MSMNKDELVSFLKEHIKLDNEELVDSIIKHIMDRGYTDKEKHHSWEQLNFIKRELDKVWIALKRCSERGVVTRRIAEMMARFPKPTPRQK